MRTLANTFLTILIIATFSFAGQSRINPDIINENIINCLTHDNEGVVESAIRVVVLVKIKYPNADFDEVIDELESLIMEGPNKNIRMKALIAADYLNNFEQYNWLQEGNYYEGDQLFDVYLNKMNLNRMATIN